MDLLDCESEYMEWETILQTHHRLHLKIRVRGEWRKGKREPTQNRAGNMRQRVGTERVRWATMGSGSACQALHHFGVELENWCRATGVFPSIAMVACGSRKHTQCKPMKYDKRLHMESHPLIHVSCIGPSCFTCRW